MKSLPLMEHLEALRKMAIHSLIIIFFAFIVTYGVTENIQNILLLPLEKELTDVGNLVYLHIFDKVLVKFQLAFMGAIVFSSPLLFWRVYHFVKPGLYENEKKKVIPLFYSSFFFFILGVLFTYFVVLPFGLKTMLEFGERDFQAMIGLKGYLLLVAKIHLVFGFIFQLPNILTLLKKIGIIHEQNRSNVRKFFYVGSAIFSALMTPPDVVTMIVLWLPLIILFEICELPSLLKRLLFFNKKFLLPKK